MAWRSQKRYKPLRNRQHHRTMLTYNNTKKRLNLIHQVETLNINMRI